MQHGSLLHLLTERHALLASSALLNRTRKSYGWPWLHITRPSELETIRDPLFARQAFKNTFALKAADGQLDPGMEIMVESNFTDY